MRKTIIYIFSILTIVTCRLSSQSTDKSDDEIMGRSSTKHKNYHKNCFSIKTDILTPIINQFYNRPTVCISFEKGFSFRHSIQVTGQYGTYKGQVSLSVGSSEPRDISQTRTELILDYKYYWKDTNDFKGFYSGLYLRGIQYDSKFPSTYQALSINNVELQYIGYCGGATIGYQNYLYKHLAIDFLFGLGVRNVFFNPSPNYDIAHIPLPLKTPFDIDIRTTINIGYKF